MEPLPDVGRDLGNASVVRIPITRLRPDNETDHDMCTRSGHIKHPENIRVSHPDHVSDHGRDHGRRVIELDVMYRRGWKRIIFTDTSKGRSWGPYPMWGWIDTSTSSTFSPSCTPQTRTTSTTSDVKSTPTSTIFEVSRMCLTRISPGT